MNPIKEKSFSFALKIISCYKYLTSERNEYVMSKQLLRSGTAIGAIYREAEHAESRADFIHKMAIAQKESSETLYWIDLLASSNYIDNELHTELSSRNIELNKLISSIIITSKAKRR
ncbi:four helix bundle protein [Robertkochia sediminum]|uniref:four helix bundle protein n=1 Tax=Robertkochia sediminum TaxID=2785326 RepID=UPI001F476D5D|nr:four helix bundle protein [Robertkochia sediminum]